MSIVIAPLPSYLKLLREFPLRPIRSAREYSLAAKILDRIAVREEDNLDSGESDYLETLSLLIEDYDRRNFPMPSAESSPLEALKFLMDQNDMTSADLGKLIGSKGTASDILHGKRAMSKAVILKLAERFKVDASLFLGI